MTSRKRTSWAIVQVLDPDESRPHYIVTCTHCRESHRYASMRAARRQASEHWRTHHAHEHFEWAARVRVEVNAT